MNIKQSYKLDYLEDQVVVLDREIKEQRDYIDLGCDPKDESQLELELQELINERQDLREKIYTLGKETNE